MNSTGYSKMSTAMYLMTLAALFKIITTTACQGDKDQLYRIFPFETSTGIYYEYQGLIRRNRAHGGLPVSLTPTSYIRIWKTTGVS